MIKPLLALFALALSHSATAATLWIDEKCEVVRQGRILDPDFCRFSSAGDYRCYAEVELLSDGRKLRVLGGECVDFASTCKGPWSEAVRPCERN